MIENYDADCHIDKDKPPEDPENYVFCDGPEAVAANITSCCTFGTNTTCCDPKGLVLVT